MTNSREKFEAHCSNVGINVKSRAADAYFDFWLAGRESMRDEAADIAESWTEYYVSVPSIGPRIAKTIKDIQP